MKSEIEKNTSRDTTFCETSQADKCTVTVRNHTIKVQVIRNRKKLKCANA